MHARFWTSLSNCSSKKFQQKYPKLIWIEMRILSRMAKLHKLSSLRKTDSIVTVLEFLIRCNHAAGLFNLFIWMHEKTVFTIFNGILPKTKWNDVRIWPKILLKEKLERVKPIETWITWNICNLCFKWNEKCGLSKTIYPSHAIIQSEVGLFHSPHSLFGHRIHKLWKHKRKLWTFCLPIVTTSVNTTPDLKIKPHLYQNKQQSDIWLLSRFD